MVDLSLPGVSYLAQEEIASEKNTPRLTKIKTRKNLFSAPRGVCLVKLKIFIIQAYPRLIEQPKAFVLLVLIGSFLSAESKASRR